MGAYWAYEELGWGGYWNWDPVENGSLIPWLAATAMIHAAMVYRQRGGLKRTTIVMAVATFAAAISPPFLPVAESSAACTRSANRPSAGCSCC